MMLNGGLDPEISFWEAIWEFQGGKLAVSFMEDGPQTCPPKGSHVIFQPSSCTGFCCVSFSDGNNKKTWTEKTPYPLVN